MDDDRMPVQVLLSGGLDSTSCTAHYLRLGYPVSALFVDYGQPARTQEAAAAEAICRHVGIHLRTLACAGFGAWPVAEIRGRNGFLLFAGLMAFPHDSGIIAIGVHAGTPFTDCSMGFVIAMQRVFDLHSDGRVLIGAPFLEWTKRDIWQYAHSMLVPVQLTYSCELGYREPCGKCRSCQDRAGLQC